MNPHRPPDRFPGAADCPVGGGHQRRGASRGALDCRTPGNRARWARRASALDGLAACACLSEAGWGPGNRPVPWIHLSDQVRAVRFLLENGEARGVYNLVAPTPTSSDEFMRALARVLRRPYWLTVPEFLLRLSSGRNGRPRPGRALQPTQTPAGCRASALNSRPSNWRCRDVLERRSRTLRHHARK